MLLKIRKIILFIALLSLAGNFFNNPNVAKAEKVTLTNIDMRDTASIITKTVPNNFSLSTTSLENRKYRLDLTWQKPAENRGEFIGYKLINIPLLGNIFRTEYRYHFDHYTVRRTVTSGQTTIENGTDRLAVIKSFDQTTYSDEIIVPTGYTNDITYQYSIQSYYERGLPSIATVVITPPILAIIAADFPGHIQNDSGPQVKNFRANGSESPDSINITQYAPFLNPVQATYNTNTNEVKASFSWGAPRVAPDTSPKYKLYFWRVQDNVENIPTNNPQESNNSSIENLHILGAVTPGVSLEYAASVKANYKDNPNWGFSQRRYFTVSRDADGNFSITDNGLGSAPDYSWVSQPTGTSESTEDDNCGCKGIYGSSWFKNPICVALCSISEALAGFLSWTLDLLLKASGVSSGQGIFTPERAYAASYWLNPTFLIIKETKC